MLKMILQAVKTEQSQTGVFLLTISEALDKSKKKKKLDNVWNI
jgi:hypothetical protein